MAICVPPSEPARGIRTRPNKLLEKQSDERLDTGTAGATVDRDSSVEAMGAIHRSKNGSG